MTRWVVLAACMFLVGCSGHRLAKYNLKASVGQTIEDTGSRSLYTGGSVDFQFEVK